MTEDSAVAAKVAADEATKAAEESIQAAITARKTVARSVGFFAKFRVRSAANFAARSAKHAEKAHYHAAQCHDASESYAEFASRAAGEEYVNEEPAAKARLRRNLLLEAAKLRSMGNEDAMRVAEVAINALDTLTTDAGRKRVESEAKQKACSSEYSKAAKVTLKAAECATIAAEAAHSIVARDRT
ncbi:MAG: hypothetical protein OXI35_02050 [Gemmatimonadota bacterium]|nr:hypothetical protein [Gemmatimonadota bacterium]